ncbi:carboxyl transferase domain protein [Medicago truncatula]|uniref:Carboxyl transferase domain protein n=1 Tax=Medicago truncatula TaxID=3880 RepID=G7ZZF9_MEDTR|nr:carboxyl transferase domain protein [Medicago truncatula]
MISHGRSTYDGGRVCRHNHNSYHDIEDLLDQMVAWTTKVDNNDANNRNNPSRGGEPIPVEGAKFRNIEERNVELQQAIVKMEQGGTAGGAYIPAMADESVMVKENGIIVLAGPPLVKVTSREEVFVENLGDAAMHCKTSDVVKNLHVAGRDALTNGLQNVSYEYKEQLYDVNEHRFIALQDLKQPFDIREAISRIVNENKFDDIKKLYGTTIVTGFAKIIGQPNIVGFMVSSKSESNGITCVQEINSTNQIFNNKLKGLVDQFNNQLPDSKFIYVNSYGIFQDIISNHSAYDFSVTNVGCCGVGRKNGQIICLPMQTPCENRR